MFNFLGGGGVSDPMPPKFDERERAVINGFFFLIFQMNRVSLQMPMARKAMVLLSSST